METKATLFHMQTEPVVLWKADELFSKKTHK